MLVSADSYDFRYQLLNGLHIQNFSNCCMHKYDKSISRIFKFDFWRDFDIRPNCALGRVNGQKKVVFRALFFQLCECVCL